MAPLLKDAVTKNCSHGSVGKATFELTGWIFYWCIVQITFISSFSQGPKSEHVLNHQLNFFQQFTVLKGRVSLCCPTQGFYVLNCSLVGSMNSHGLVVTLRNRNSEDLGFIAILLNYVI